MPFPIVIETIDTRPDEMSPAAWRKAVGAGCKAAAELWRDEMLPQHFKPQAKGEYHYQPRTAQYVKRKMALARAGKAEDGGLSDLVLTGELRRWVLSTPRITQSGPSATVTMSGPRYLWMVPKNNRQPDKAAEILRVIDAERQRITEVMDDATSNAILSMPQTERTGAGASVTAYFHTLGD